MQESITLVESASKSTDVKELHVKTNPQSFPSPDPTLSLEAKARTMKVVSFSWDPRPTGPSTCRY